MREHEVPTHLQTEDKVLLGLTFPQIVAIAAVVGLAYGLWKQAAFLPDGAFRLGAAIVVGLLGLAMVAVRPGGRGLPTVILDLLRFALSPKRYEGEVTALLNPPVATPPKPKSQKKKGRRRLWRFRLKGLPFKCLSLLLAVMVILTSIAPSAALAAGPASGPDPQRLFIEAWRVRGNEAELTLRAATSLEVQVTTETHDRYRPFYTQGVLYRGEPRRIHHPPHGKPQGHRHLLAGRPGQRRHPSAGPEQHSLPPARAGDRRLRPLHDRGGLAAGQRHGPPLQRLQQPGGGGRRSHCPHRPGGPRRSGEPEAAPGCRRRRCDRRGLPGGLGGRVYHRPGLRPGRRHALQLLPSPGGPRPPGIPSSGHHVDPCDPPAGQGGPHPQRGAVPHRTDTRHRPLCGLLSHGELDPERLVRPGGPYGFGHSERLVLTRGPHPLGNPERGLGGRHPHRGRVDIRHRGQVALGHRERRGVDHPRAQCFRAPWASGYRPS